MAIKTIRVLGELGEAERRELVLALRLMTASESMRSALRNLGRLPRGDFTPPSEADRYYLLFAAIGAAGETIVTGRFKTGHRWALQNRPRCVWVKSTSITARLSRPDRSGPVRLG